MEMQIAKCSVNNNTHKITIDTVSRYTAVLNTDMRRKANTVKFKKDNPIYIEKVKLFLDAGEISKITNEPIGFIKHASEFDRPRIYLRTQYLIIGVYLLNLDTGNWDHLNIDCICHDNNHLDHNEMDCEIEFSLKTKLCYINKTNFSMQFRFVYIPGYTYATKLEGEKNGRKGSKV